MFSKSFSKLAVLAIVSPLLGVGTAQAGLERGDFMEILDIPTLATGIGPRVFAVQNRGVQPNTITVPELTDNEEIQNPSGYNGYLSVDVEPSNAASNPNTITLRHEETNTGYQFAKITIGDIEFDDPDELIAGVTLNSGAIIDTLNSDPFTQTVEFTDHSITFLFQVRDMAPGQIFHFLVDGSIQYLVDIGVRTATIPEPASLLLFGASIAGLGLSGRRRQSSSNRKVMS
jgi:hypothetical protein